ncbi:hypothetical protein NMG60_11013616 [Bertholletia excelsa]
MASWFTPTVLFCLLHLVIGIIFIMSIFKPHPKHHRPEEPDPPHLVRAPSLLERVRSINLSLYRFNSFEPETQLFDHHHGEALTKQPELDTASHPSQHVYPPLEEVPTKQPEGKTVPLAFTEQRGLDAASHSSQHVYPPPEAVPTKKQERETVPSTRLDRTPSFLERLWSNIPIHVNPPDEEVSTGETGPTRIGRARSILNQMGSINLSFRRSEPVEGERSDNHDHHVTRNKSAASDGEPVDPTRMKKSASERAMLDEEEEEEMERRRPATVRERHAVFSGEDEGVDAKADDFINRFKQQLKLQRLDSLLRYREMLNRGAGR